MIAEVEKINAPLKRIYQSLSIKKLCYPLLSFILGRVMKRLFLGSKHRGRDPVCFVVHCWVKTQDRTLVPVMSG